MRWMLSVGWLAVFATALSFGWNPVGVNLARAQGKAKQPQHVLIIRHAEKTGEKTDLHLSKKGLERADVLFQLFEKSKSRPNPFPTPDFVFAASNSTSSQRPLETVTPLALKLKLHVDHRYESKRSAGLNKNDPKESTGTAGMLDLRAEVFGNPKYFGKTILVSWRHSTIPDLAKTLGAKNAPTKWADNVFDRVWQLSFDDQGNIAFLDRPQRLLPGDAND